MSYQPTAQELDLMQKTITAMEEALEDATLCGIGFVQIQRNVALGPDGKPNAVYGFETTVRRVDPQCVTLHPNCDGPHGALVPAREPERCPRCNGLEPCGGC